ncbi:glycogen phosphorylase [Klebsiella variicola]|uniref:Alpha-1,4 glucan phosphorylase n=1 Tax=Klebsiella variicola TaxID=244366 RepID=A0A7H4M905_KLEVA|nr:glycogen phosphorylase [Klebsiella variicola]
MVNSTRGDYFAAVEDKNHSENVSRVLYPDDSTYSGRELRLRQEYFLVSATVQDILSRHYMLHKTFDNLADKIAIHLNDTHPVLSIPELMRLLIDEHKFSWDEAFEVTCQVFSYTNHTLMSEALETWPVDMLGKILPRHLQIIFEINDYFLKTLQEQYPNDTRCSAEPRLSTSPTAVACGWPGWRWWSATRSTACRSCIRG